MEFVQQCLLPYMLKQNQTVQINFVPQSLQQLQITFGLPFTVLSLKYVSVCASNCNRCAPLFHRPGFYLIFFSLRFSTFKTQTTKRASICEIAVLNSFLSQCIHYAYVYIRMCSIIWVDSTHSLLNPSHIHFQYNNYNTSNIRFDAIDPQKHSILHFKY